MDCTTNTEDALKETKTFQENLLFSIIKEICSENVISSKLNGKLNRIIAESDLSHYTGLHKLSTADESTSTLLGLMNQTSTELTFDEQTELNQAIINKIQTKIPKFTRELEQLSKAATKNKTPKKEQIKKLQEGLDEKLNTLEEQEKEKVDLMMEWLNHRLQDVMKYSDNSSELLTLKTKILDLKSKILHLQILQNIFTETNQSIKAYKEVHKDLKDSIKETESRIRTYRQIINDNDI